MKIRTNFVSNSSSSSFLIETTLTKDELYEKIEIFCDLVQNYYKTIYNNENYDYYKGEFTLEEIRKNVEIFDCNKDKIEPWLYDYYDEELHTPKKQFKNKILILGDDNYLPEPYDLETYLDHQDNIDVVAYSGHMG